MKKLSFFLMAIVASLGLAWAVGGDSLLPQLKGALGGLTDGSSLAQTKGLTLTSGVSVDYWCPGHGWGNKQTTYPVNGIVTLYTATDLKNSGEFNINVWTGNGGTNQAYSMNPLPVGQLVTVTPFKVGYESKDGYVKIDNYDSSKKYRIEINLNDNTFLVTELVDRSYALNADFLPNTEEVSYPESREEWGAELFEGPNADGLYELQIEIEDGGAFVIQALNGGSLSSPEEEIYGDVDVAAAGVSYTLSTTEEDFGAITLPAGTYTLIFNPETKSLLAKGYEYEYVLVGGWNGYSTTSGFYPLHETEEGSGIWEVRVNRIMAQGSSFAIVKNGSKAKGNAYYRKSTIGIGGSLTLQNALKFNNNNCFTLSESVEIPVFTFNPTTKQLTLTKWVNENIYDNSDIPGIYTSSNTSGTGQADKFFLKGANLTVDGYATNWDTSGDDRNKYCKFVASDNEKYPAADGWMVLRKVKFNAKDFGIVRATSNNAQYKYENQSKDSYGWIWAKDKDNAVVQDQEPTEAAYGNYPKKEGQLTGKNFEAATLGTYDIFFNPKSMQIIFGGSYAWQLYGEIATGKYEAIAMNPEYNEESNEPTGNWTITLENAKIGTFVVRHSEPTYDSGWNIVGSKQDNTDPNSNVINKAKTYPGSNSGYEWWENRFNGEIKLTFNPDTYDLTVEVVNEAPTPDHVRFEFANGDIITDETGYLQISNRTPADHNDAVENHLHGAYIIVVYSDGSRKYLVSAEDGTEDSVHLGELQKLKLSDTRQRVYFDLGEEILDKSYDFVLNWRELDPAYLTIRRKGDPIEFRPEGEFNRYIVYGNVWGGNEWAPFAELNPTADGWWVANNIQFDGTNFGIRRANAEGLQYYNENGNQIGWFFGTNDGQSADGYYINDGNVHKCVNEELYANAGYGNGHNLVLGQPGTYTVWFKPKTDGDGIGEIIVYGEYMPTNFQTVYFADRNYNGVTMKGAIKAYIYNNNGVDPNGGKNSYEDIWAAWDGVDMELLADTHPLYSLVDSDDDNHKIYSLTYDMNRFPRVIFNHGHWEYYDGGQTWKGDQTRNLTSVPNGVYYFDEELLPSNYYYDNGTDEPTMLDYPNEYHSTSSNIIYVDVDEFTNHNGDISFSIAWEKDGHRFVTTGIRGTTKGYLVEFPNGKKYIALDLTEAAIPDGTMMELYVWEGTDKSKYNTCGVSGHDHESLDDMDKNCTNAHRPLAFENIEYKNGNIYRRSEDGEVSSIYEEQKPDHVWIVGVGNGLYVPSITEGDDDVKVTEPVELTPNAKLEYTYEKVCKQSEFVFKADYNGKIYWYSYNSTGISKMKPYNATKANYFDTELTDAGYGIDHPERWTHINLYDVAFNWTKHDVIAKARGTEPGFQIRHVDKENFGTNQFYKVKAIANDSEGGAQGWFVKDKNGNEMEISMNPTSLLVAHAANFGGDKNYPNEDHYNATVVTVEPTEDYSSYFGNKSANLKPVHRGLAPHNDYEDPTESHIEVKAYTAGLYNVSIDTPNLYSREQADQVVFKNSRLNMPMYVYPSIESIGLTVNGKGVIPEMDAAAPEYNEGSDLFVVIEPNPEQIYQTYHNGNLIKWDPAKRVCMETTMADGNNVEIYFRVVNETARSLVRRETSTDVGKPYNDEPDDTYTKYSMWNTLNSENLGLVNENGEAKTSPTQVEFIVKQNGVTGKPQTVNVYAAQPADLPTSVEEIEMPSEDEVLGNDAEAVYYDVNGIRVDAENLLPGVYVVVKGDKTEKIYVK